MTRGSQNPQQLLNADEREQFFGAMAMFDASEEQILADVPRLGLVKATHALRAAINWAFVAWHRSHDVAEISGRLARSARRGVEVVRRHPVPAGRAMRECFDSFLMQCAILSGDRGAAESAAGAVIVADASERYQYIEGWTGVLAARVLGRREDEACQAEIMRRTKPSRTYLWPSPALVDQFVARDYRSFAKTLKGACEKHWKIAERDGALAVADDGRVTLDLGRKHEHFFWPYAEAVFAKLAARDGTAVEYDGFWLPDALARG